MKIVSVSINELNKINQLLIDLYGIKNGVSFANIIYTNQEGEVQQTTFNVGVSYDKAKQKDIEYLTYLNVEDIKSDLPTELIEEARVELLNALLKPNKAQSEGQKNAYTHLTNGLKVHNETEQLYLFGMKVKKKVLKEANYSEDTRKPLTKAKDTIRAKMKSTQYRQYKINSTAKISLCGDTITFEE